MAFLPDPGDLEAIADRIGGHARAARARAQRLAAAVGASAWRGPAADAFHVEAFALIAALRGAAGRLDDAADTLRRHAGRVRAVIDDLRSLGTDGARTLDDLVHHPGRLPGDLAGLVGDGADVVGDALSAIGI